MRLKDYAIGHSRRRLRARRMRLLLGLQSRAPTALLLKLQHSVRRTQHDINIFCLRSRQISTTSFNLNIYSDEHALSEFRFRASEIGKIRDIISWSGIPTRNRYRCDSITATCILPKRMSFPTRWKDLQTTFGMRSSALCEVFWEVFEEFIEERSHLLETFKADRRDYQS